MGTICYSWNDAPYKWMETPFTWKEACVIEKIIATSGIVTKNRRKLKDLTKEEKQTLIGLFVRLNVDEIEFETNLNKFKNKKVTVRLKDVEMLMKEQKNITVDVTIIKN
jgi:hypothetical protein